eukprot:3562977-Rhodomonas_salina.1
MLAMAADLRRLKRKGILQRVSRQDDANVGIWVHQHESSGKPCNTELAPPTNPDLMLLGACFVQWFGETLQFKCSSHQLHSRLAACSKSETDLLTDRELDMAARGFYQWASLTRQDQTCYDEGEDGQNYCNLES